MINIVPRLLPCLALLAAWRWGSGAAKKILRRHLGPYGGEGPGTSCPNTGGPLGSPECVGCPTFSISLPEGWILVPGLP